MVFSGLQKSIVQVYILISDDLQLHGSIQCGVFNWIFKLRSLDVLQVSIVVCGLQSVHTNLQLLAAGMIPETYTTALSYSTMVLS